MKVGVYVVPRAGLADPQSETVKDNLHKLGFKSVRSCAIGRWMTLDVEASGKEDALKQAKEMCQKLLLNPIMEDATYHLLEER